MLSEILPKRQILIFHGVGALPSRAVDSAERNFWSREDTLLGVANAAVIDNCIEITFDDGNISDLRVAAPILAERGLSATFFILGGRIGWQDFLSARDIRELDRLGMVVGSHGMDHVHWPAVDDVALHRELAVSKSVLEDILGKPVLTAAVPFGDFDGRSLRKALSVGYQNVYTSSGGFASKVMRILPRTSVRNESYPVLGVQDRLISGVRNHARLLKHRVNGYASMTSAGQD
ncbi:polysaccharide deacetylase family protein [Roseococcus pinisoli]|uniref:Chitooligosaccharide deacetylase n=1 Tax=Roseococcus pinisoli TaxID=2835040 RepID=A0ABS5QDG2_9PROT|nr:polysaccharide deacetylase family protein [Roseococcus pinisoli]MBS7811739.1 polysaccharide deacetylase family protein [Roseococcus pinisoli]